MEVAEKAGNDSIDGTAMVENESMELTARLPRPAFCVWRTGTESMPMAMEGKDSIDKTVIVGNCSAEETGML